MRERLRSLPVFAAPLPHFAVEQAPDRPSALYVEWLTGAIEAGVPEPHAMTLSTVDASGRPDARVLILKDVDEAQAKMTELAKELAEKGEIMIAKNGGEEELVY